MSTKVQMVCRRCGSTQVLRDAWAEWDVDTQQWTLSAVFDHAVCESDACDGGETSIDEEEIEEEITTA